MTEAEVLIGRRGYDAVSIRDITAAAKSDVSAVHYHFGSKRDLVAAILSERLTELNQQRAPLLDALMDVPRPTLRDIATTLVGPAVAKRGKVKERNAFFNAVVDHAEFAKIVEGAIDPEISLYMRLLERALPGVPSGVLIARLLFAITLVQAVLASAFPGRQRWMKRYPTGARRDQADDLIEFIAAAFDGIAPSTG